MVLGEMVSQGRGYSGGGRCGSGGDRESGQAIQVGVHVVRCCLSLEFLL